MKRYIFGAKATAAGLFKAIAIQKSERIDGFLVSKKEGNPEKIWGCPVLLLEEVALTLSKMEKMEALVYVAVPELIHEDIKNLLEEKGFFNLEMLDSKKEACIMEQYYEQEGRFLSIHSLPMVQENVILDKPKLTVYAASYYKDTPLEHPPILSDYVKKLYLGCEKARGNGADIYEQADFYDDEGDNISAKNANRCEMTAHYWIWKNRLETDDEYVGVYHYRRMLDINDDDLRRIKANDVDVVLPYPMIHYPDSQIHHTWYVPEDDWNTMRRVLGELQPEYEKQFDNIFAQPYFYNYNMLIAKKEVFADYCGWIYPILERIETVSKPKGADRQDRYTAYLSESLMTLYFMVRQKDFKIYHTGRLLFT